MKAPTVPNPPQTSSRARAARPSSQAGFSLIEVLATALVVILLSAGVATALVAQTHASGDQQLRSQANTLVNQDQDRLRGLSDQALSNLASNGPTTSQPQTVGNQSYTITSSASYVTASGASSCASNAIDYFKISSTATWSEAFAGGNTQSVTADSLLARPVTGELQTVVSDQTGAGLPGVSVTASGTGLSGQSGLTDSTGCSLFAGLGAGTYTVTATKSGYVTPLNQTNATSPASVTNTGSIASATFTLGQAGSVAASFQAAAPSAPGQADGVMYAGAGPGYTTVSGQGTTTTLPAATQTASSLFPFESTANTPVYNGNYSVYGGQCSYQSPPAANLTSASVSPGGSATATVKEPFLYIKTVSIAGVATVQPTDIVLTYSSGGCVDSYQATVAAPGTGSGLGATAPSTGWLASPGQPYAATSSVLTVCADYKTVAGVYVNGTATTANSSFTSMNPSTTGLTISALSLGQCVAQ